MKIPNRVHKPLSKKISLTLLDQHALTGSSRHSVAKANSPVLDVVERCSISVVVSDKID